MKVVNLEINEFRGIKNLKLEFNGDNACISGPNGSGKSAVVDALDFLLTGKISRLTGEGTSGIYLKDYGRHIDAHVDESYVKASLQLGSPQQNIVVKRELKNPSILIFDNQYANLLKPIQDIANRGQYVLLRKHLLQYIVAKGSDRAKAINGLLKIDDVEKARSELMSKMNSHKRNYSDAQKIRLDAERDVKEKVQLATYNETEVKNEVNESREALNGDPLEHVSKDNIIEGISLPEVTPGIIGLNTTTTYQSLDALTKSVNDDYVKRLRDSIASFMASFQAIFNNPESKRVASLKTFISGGLALLDETGKCPLCETPWEKEELKKFLQRRYDQSALVSKEFGGMDRKKNELNTLITEIENHLQSFIRVMKPIINNENLMNSLKSWLENLRLTKKVLENLFEISILSELEKILIVERIIPDNVNEIIENAKQTLSEFSMKKSPEQIHWDRLNQLIPLFANLEKAKLQELSCQKKYERAKMIYDSFLEARDLVLKDLFDSIAQRFETLYRFIHGEDEKDFSADLIYSEAAINFEVDFYGRGKKPPQALHSEGHQDSMGLCLYLALAEKLTQGVFYFLVLDDIVMSVDADHRRQLSKLLVSEFSNFQFVITTHDRIWAKHLEIDGVVPNNNVINFFNWNIQLGPLVSKDDTENWEWIHESLQRNDISAASAKLRRTSENFLSNVCENIGAQVEYKADNSRSFAELGVAASKRYMELLRRSIKSANSWNNTGMAEQLEQTKIRFEEINKRQEIERWAINPSTHFNEWENFTANDFLPLISAYKDFFDSFKCPSCGAIVRVVKNKNREDSLSCPCKTILYNLEIKPSVK